ncbi:Uncharacterised protein [Burkholderia pseudomallei]|uniref:hypothetical protein n=1 Tax=Burkholderia pseudomallei TaxID=28450 RepID=UPI000F17F831|nr:hypothetical protein [Burkholderia pseudomallei]VBM56237.1 Uncharacterised protein [Burkholderia pseudomallei]
MNTREKIMKKFESLRKKAMEAAQVCEDGESLYKLVNDQYKEILKMALQERRRRSAPVIPRIGFDDPDENYVHRCPHCGASDEYSTDHLWLGASEFEPCRFCGAAIEHSDERFPLRQPIEQWSLEDLFEELREVQRVYESKPTTYEEAGQNREYFHRLASALAQKKHAVGEGSKPKRNLFNTRSEIKEWEQEKRNFDILYRYAIDLIGEIDGQKVAKYLCDYGLGVNDIGELRGMVDGLELERQAKYSLK